MERVEIVHRKVPATETMFFMVRQTSFFFFRRRGVGNMFVGMYYICSRDFRYHGVIGRFGNGNHCIKFHSFLVMEYQRGRVFNYYEKIPFLDRNVFGCLQ